MSHKPVIIIIPGVGDRSRAYEIFAVVWRLLGYEAHIIAFGWVDMASRLESKRTPFLKKIDAFDESRGVYLIGISAGGTAAVNTFAVRPSLVRKVITVCSPLNGFENLRNPLLAESIEQARSDLERMDAAQKQRILSVRALYDQVVNTKLSIFRGVKNTRVWSFLHAPTIFVALTFCAPRLRRFLKKAT